MPQGVNSKTGKSNCELEQCVAAKIKAHKGKPAPTNKTLKIIDAITKVLNSNVLSLSSNENLFDTLNMKKPSIDIHDITMAILNMDKDGIIKAIENDNHASAFTKILYRLEPYLPKNLKMSYRAVSNMNCCDKTKQAITEFAYFIISKSNELEDMITQKYYYTGKMHTLEILKRRYRSNWGDNNKSVEVKTSKEEDKDETVVTINFI